MLYVGGGCLDASQELREFVRRTGIPVAQTLMGLGTFPASDPLALQVGVPHAAAGPQPAAGPQVLPGLVAMRTSTHLQPDV